jgi:lipopolysaccharide biosynthesis glycosyltransferase
LNIAYLTSDEYSQYCGVSLLSLLENNKNEEIINIYIYDVNIKDSNKSKLSDLAKKYKRHIEFVKKHELVHSIVNPLGLSGGLSNLIYLYIKCMPDYIFPVTDRLLYIDTDTIINGSLHALYNIDLGEHYIAAVPELTSRYVSSENKEIRLHKLFYYNTGVILYNIPKIIEGNFSQRVFDSYYTCVKPLKLPEQSLLNWATTDDDVLPIHYKYNYNIYIHYNLRKDVRPKVQKEYADLGIGYKGINYKKRLKANKIVIIHYLAIFRPWVRWRFAHLGLIYRKYWKKSPWRNNKRKSYIRETIIRKIRNNPNSPFANKYLGYLYGFVFVVVERYFISLLRWYLRHRYKK